MTNRRDEDLAKIKAVAEIKAEIERRKLTLINNDHAALETRQLRLEQQKTHTQGRKPTTVSDIKQQLIHVAAIHERMKLIAHERARLIKLEQEQKQRVARALATTIRLEAEKEQ